MKKHLIIVLLLYANHTFSTDVSTENIFTDTEKYRLKLQAVVTYPFVEDDQGVYTGTALLIDKTKGWLLEK